MEPFRVSALQKDRRMATSLKLSAGSGLISSESVSSTSGAESGTETVREKEPLLSKRIAQKNQGMK